MSSDITTKKYSHKSKSSQQIDEKISQLYDELKKTNMLNYPLIKKGGLSEGMSTKNFYYASRTVPEVPAEMTQVPDPNGVLVNGYTQPLPPYDYGDPSTWDAMMDAVTDTSWLFNPNEVAGETGRPVLHSMPQSMSDAANASRTSGDSPYDQTGGGGIVITGAYWGTGIGYVDSGGKYKSVCSGGLIGGTNIPTPESRGMFGYYSGRTDAEFAIAVWYWNEYLRLVDEGCPTIPITMWQPWSYFWHGSAAPTYEQYPYPKRNWHVLMAGAVFQCGAHYESAPYVPPWNEVLQQDDLGNSPFYHGNLNDYLGDLLDTGPAGTDYLTGSAFGEQLYDPSQGGSATSFGTWSDYINANGGDSHPSDWMNNPAINDLIDSIFEAEGPNSPLSYYYDTTTKPGSDVDYHGIGAGTPGGMGNTWGPPDNMVDFTNNYIWPTLDQIADTFGHISGTITGGVTGLTISAMNDIRNFIHTHGGRGPTDVTVQGLDGESLGLTAEEFLNGGAIPALNTSQTGEGMYSANLALSLNQSIATGNMVMINNNHVDPRAVGSRFTNDDLTHMFNVGGVVYGAPNSLPKDANSILNPNADTPDLKHNYFGGKGFGMEGGSISQVYIDANGVPRIRNTADKTLRVGGESGEGVYWDPENPFTPPTLTDIPGVTSDNIASIVNEIIKTDEFATSFAHLGNFFTNSSSSSGILGPISSNPADMLGNPNAVQSDFEVTEQVIDAVKDHFRTPEMQSLVATMTNNPVMEWASGKAEGSINGMAIGSLMYGAIKESLGLQQPTELQSQGGYGHVRRESDISIADLNPAQQAQFISLLNQSGVSFNSNWNNPNLPNTYNKSSALQAPSPRLAPSGNPNAIGNPNQTFSQWSAPSSTQTNWAPPGAQTNWAPPGAQTNWGTGGSAASPDPGPAPVRPGDVPVVPSSPWGPYKSPAPSRNTLAKRWSAPTTNTRSSGSTSQWAPPGAPTNWNRNLPNPFAPTGGRGFAPPAGGQGSAPTAGGTPIAGAPNMNRQWKRGESPFASNLTTPGRGTAPRRVRGRSMNRPSRRSYTISNRRGTNRTNWPTVPHFRRIAASNQLEGPLLSESVQENQAQDPTVMDGTVKPYQIEVSEKELLRNHRLTEIEKRQLRDTVKVINEYIAKHPQVLDYVKERYPKHDVRLAELNYKLDKQTEAAGHYMDKNFPENLRLYDQVQKSIRHNIKQTDPKVLSKNVEVGEFKFVQLEKVSSVTRRDRRNILETLFKKSRKSSVTRFFETYKRSGSVVTKHLDIKSIKEKYSRKKELEERTRREVEESRQKQVREDMLLNMLAAKERSDWRSDTIVEISGMTTKGVTAEYLPAMGDANLSTLSGSSIASDFNYGSGRSSGTGTGLGGGFNIGNHIELQGFEQDGTESQYSRSATTAYMDCSKYDTIVISGIVGNGSNGGQRPGNDLWCIYSTRNGNYGLIGPNDGYDPLISKDASGGLEEYVLDLPPDARTDATSFQFYQSVSDVYNGSQMWPDGTVIPNSETGLGADLVVDYHGDNSTMNGSGILGIVRGTFDPSVDSDYSIFYHSWWMTTGAPGPYNGWPTATNLYDSIMIHDAVKAWAEKTCASYGIKDIKFRRRLPLNIMVGLDRPEASAFIRIGNQLQGLSPGERRKMFEEMMEAAKEYQDKYLGTDFPGSNTDFKGVPAGPNSWADIEALYTGVGNQGQNWAPPGAPTSWGGNEVAQVAALPMALPLLLGGGLSTGQITAFITAIGAVAGGSYLLQQVGSGQMDITDLVPWFQSTQADQSWLNTGEFDNAAQGDTLDKEQDKTDDYDTTRENLANKLRDAQRSGNDELANEIMNEIIKMRRAKNKATKVRREKEQQEIKRKRDEYNKKKEQWEKDQAKAESDKVDAQAARERAIEAWKQRNPGKELPSNEADLIKALNDIGASIQFSYTPEGDLISESSKKVQNQLFADIEVIRRIGIELGDAMKEGDAARITGLKIDEREALRIYQTNKGLAELDNQDWNAWKTKEDIRKSTFGQINDLRKSFVYKGQPTPSPDGFPTDPVQPPGADGFSPKYAQGHENRYKRLDPQSAETMSGAPTGDPKIDDMVNKQRYSWRKSLRKEDINWVPMDTGGIANKTTNTFGLTQFGMPVDGADFTQVTGNFGGLGGVESQVQFDYVGAEGEPNTISPPNYPDLALAGYAKPIDMLRGVYANAAELNKNLQISKQYTKIQNSDAYMDGRVPTYDEIMDDRIKEADRIYDERFNAWQEAKKAVDAHNDNIADQQAALFKEADALWDKIRAKYYQGQDWGDRAYYAKTDAEMSDEYLKSGGAEIDAKIDALGKAGKEYPPHPEYPDIFDDNYWNDGLDSSTNEVDPNKVTPSKDPSYWEKKFSSLKAGFWQMGKITQSMLTNKQVHANPTSKQINEFAKIINHTTLTLIPVSDTPLPYSDSNFKEVDGKLVQHHGNSPDYTEHLGFGDEGSEIGDRGSAMLQIVTPKDGEPYILYTDHAYMNTNNPDDATAVQDLGASIVQGISKSKPTGGMDGVYGDVRTEFSIPVSSLTKAQQQAVFLNHNFRKKKKIDESLFNLTNA